MSPTAAINPNVPPKTPEIVAPVWLRGIGANIAATTIFTATRRGFYRVNVYHEVPTLATTGTMDTTIGYTDQVGATTVLPAAQISVAAASANRRKGGVTAIECMEGTAVTYAVTFAGLTGVPACTLRIELERIG